MMGYTFGSAYGKLAIDAAGNNGRVHLWTSDYDNENQIFNIYKLSDLGIQYTEPAAPTVNAAVDLRNPDYVVFGWSSNNLGQLDNRVYNAEVYEGTTSSGTPSYQKLNTTEKSWTLSLKPGTYTLKVTAVNTKYSNKSNACTKTFTVNSINYTISYNANGGSGAPANQTKTYGQTLTLSTTAPTRPCHTFLGWAASASATSASYQPGQSYTANANLTLYAVWAEGVSTEWSTTKPTGVDESLIETKTQYRYRDKETKTSYEPNLSGYTLTSTNLEKIGSGYTDYVAAWPGGFDRANGYFSQYNKSPKSNTDTATSKTEVSPAYVCGYLYWHWCAGYQYGPVNRLISDVYTDARPFFHAFFTTEDAPHSDPNGVYDPDCYYYWYRDCCGDSYWWFRLNVFRQPYTEYRKVFTYERWGSWSAWSDSKYTESSTRQVEERTLYRYTQDGADVHSWDSGTITTAAKCTTAGVKTYTCSKCGKTRTESIPALGHNWGSWSVTTPATATSPGVETRTCSRCGQTETRETPQLQSYLVTYNANGGTGQPADQNKIQGTALTLSSTQPSRANSSAGSYTVTLNANGGTVSPTSLSATRTTSYSFKNWNTAANGSGTSYAPGASYTANAAVTLYAQWNSSTSTKEVALPTAAREGSIFLGWAKSSTAADAQYKAGDKLTPIGNLTLYAVWLDLSKPDGELPSALKELGDEALAGCAFRYVKLPDGMNKLGSRVFDGSLKLRAVYVPESVTTIASTAFDGALNGLTIVGEAGSYAEFFASRHGLNFVEG